MGYSYQSIGVVRSGADRATLVRRTYALVFASVCVTVLGTWFGLGQPEMMAAVIQHPWITMLCTFAPLFLAMRARTAFPQNVVLVGLFSFVMGLTMAPVIYMMERTNPGVTGNAAILTLSTFGVLTGYAFVSRRDFSAWGSFFTIGLWVLIATSLLPGAADALATKPNVRVLLTGNLDHDTGVQLEYRSVNGGLLVQDRDQGRVRVADLRCVTQRQPTEAELRDLSFAWRVCKYVKSNAIVFAQNEATIGVGAGQMSRVYSTRIAAIKAVDAGLEVKGSVVASDAFFPFRDGVDAAASHGITALIQPGGSMRDDDVIAAANEHGLAMLFTGMRHFRH